MLKAILFDYNGTLLDDRALNYLSICEIYKAVGVNPPEEEEWFENLGSNYMDNYYFHGYPKGDLKKDRVIINNIRDQFIKENWLKGKLRPGAKEVVRQCSKLGLATGIVSAETWQLLNNRMRKENMRAMFNVICAEAWPKKEHLKRTLSQLEVLPSESVYVDDTYEGLSVAREIGMLTIGFINFSSYGSYPRIVDAGPDVIVSSLKDMLPYLRRWMK